MNIPADTKEIPDGLTGYVDVRDVARLHVHALFNDNYDNGRWFLLAGRPKNQTLLDLIHKYRPEESANLAIGTPGAFNTSQLYKFDNAKTLKVLDFELIPLEKSIIDMYDAVLLLKRAEEDASKEATL